MSAGALFGLIRWPGALTAAANAMTGFLVAHATRPTPDDQHGAAWGVAAAGAIVYAGGVVLNDVADAARDASLHPSRPIPSGRVTPQAATVFGIALLAAGTVISLVAGGVLAAAMTGAAALFAFAYDFAVKEFRIPGTAVLALARGSNAMAGAFAGAAAADATGIVRTPLVAVYVIAVTAYTALLTFASTFEDRAHGKAAAGGFALALFACAALPWAAFSAAWRTAPAFAFVPLLVTLVVAARDAADREGPGIGLLIRTGVFGFLLADAAWLFGIGRYDNGFVLLLAYVAMRVALSRARS